MKKIAYYIILCTLPLCTFSCRPLGDDLLSYGQTDTNAYAQAGNSFAGEFKTLWLAMNENYGIWDYEEAKGLNWDAVYATYLPKFEALDDTLLHKTKVTDAELKALYEQFLDSLHDGHLMVQIFNRHTNKYIEIVPSKARNLRERAKEMEDEGEDNATNLDYYRALSPSNPLCAGACDAIDAKFIVVEEMDTVCSRLVRAADIYIAGVDNAGGPDKYNDSLYSAVKKVRSTAQYIRKNADKARESDEDFAAMIVVYNNMCSAYDLVGTQLDVNMPTIEESLTGDELEFIASAVFNGGIAYLRFGGFALTSYLDKPAPDDTTSLVYAYHTAVNRVWHNWFDTIQTLHANGQLGGVIIDVRNNEGGAIDDYAYVLGALLPSGNFSSHYLRVKNGTGRLDFAPVVPFEFPTYTGAHAVIKDEPIVVLANIHSNSMAEMTTFGVKSLPNGHFIGTRTWGGLSALLDAPAAYSQTYSGCFGVKDVTPVYGFVPRYVALFGEDMHVLEGVGITPDEVVPLDVTQWKSAKRDNQLEAALKYIRSK